jgi:Fe-S cluster biosynthesis and repair protein YggX
MPHCEVRTCCLTKKLQNCYFCPDFSKCEKLNYQKETYDVGKHLQRIKHAGYENWLKEQRKKINESFDNIQYLEKRK